MTCIRAGMAMTLVNNLLNNLETERYVPAAVLLTLVDELSSSPGCEIAANAAREILDNLESGRLPRSELLSRVEYLRGLVRSMPPPSSSHRNAAA